MVLYEISLRNDIEDQIASSRHVARDAAKLASNNANFRSIAVVQAVQRR